MASEDARFDRVNRIARRWMIGSLIGGGVIVGIGGWLGALELAVMAGVVSVAVIWGFLGSLSLLSAEGAVRVQRSLTTARINRRIRAGTAEPTRGAVSMTAYDDTGALTEVTEDERPPSAETFESIT